MEKPSAAFVVCRMCAEFLLSVSLMNRQLIIDVLTCTLHLLQLRSALDRIDELEASNSHLSKRLEKMKANRNALLAQQ